MNPHTLPSPSEFRHSTDLQIRFSDVDVLGHVNNTVYMSFYDTGKAYFFTELLGKRVEWKTVDTVIANVDCCFVSPIYFGEEVEVLSRCEAIHQKSFEVLQMIVEKSTREVKSACRTVMVCFDQANLCAKEMPEVWRRALVKSMAAEGRPAADD